MKNCRSWAYKFVKAGLKASVVKSKRVLKQKKGKGQCTKTAINRKIYRGKDRCFLK